MANTPAWGLPYPTDYQQPADSPAALQQLATATDTAITAAQTHNHAQYAQAIPSGTYVADGQVTAVVFVVPGSLAAGQEIELGPFGITPGTYCVCTVQHPSTFVYAVYNDRGDGTAVVKVRNGTTSTTHSNVKVHAIFINPPGGA